MESDNVIRLIDLKTGESLKVMGIKTDDVNLKRRLNDQGITKGVTITIKGIAPLGSPVHLKLRGYDLALEKKYLEYIEGLKV